MGELEEASLPRGKHPHSWVWVNGEAAGRGGTRPRPSPSRLQLPQSLAPPEFLREARRG